MNSLFTYIFEFQGGTYISQIESDDLKNSLPKWIDEITEDQNKIAQLGSKIIHEIKNQLISDYSDNTLTPLDGLLNVWCTPLNTKKGMGLLNIVKTANNQPE